MKKIAFISTNKSAWGGSEYLWYHAALRLSGEGISTEVSVPRWKTLPEELGKLKEAGINVRFNTDVPSSKRLFNKVMPQSLKINYDNEGLKFLTGFSPDLAVISQGGNTGGIDAMEFCASLGIPYVTISQAANEAKWPSDELNERLSKALPASRKNFYVCKANIKLTEKQTGQKIENAEIIFNPVNVRYNIDLPYPDTTGTISLANVARHEFYAKGQDVLLEVLSDEKWRNRDLKVILYGKGEHTKSLKKLVNYYSLDKIEFGGHISPEEIWRTNHALILTSRYEGLPLALLESMLCGRTAIATSVSGIPELIRDNENGFLAGATKAEFVDEALERAWQRKDEWKSIGMKAREDVRKFMPEDPVGHFCERLKNV